MQLNNFIYIYFFIIGTLFGSFFSLATYRIPRKQDIILEQSYCTKCNHKLYFWDLIPILSYIFLMGKCRYCNQKISPKYLIFEILNGIVFLALSIIFGLSINLIIAILVYISLFLILGCYLSYMGIKKDMQIDGDNIKKVNNKGYINIDLAIGIVVFMIFFTSIIISKANSDRTIASINNRANAVNLAVSTIESILQSNYDEVSGTYNEDVNLDGVIFKKNVNIRKYIDMKSVNQDVLKIVEVTIQYKEGKLDKEYKLSTLKVKTGGTI